jgi:membrane-associated phospholipid phosphatase
MRRFYSKHLQLALLLSLISGLGLALLLLYFGNERLFLLINQKFTPDLGAIASWFSLLGESWAMGFLLFLSLWMPVRISIQLLLCWLIGALHSWIFKLWLCRGWPRPYPYFQKQGIALHLVEGIKINHWNSFPSGHTITAFSLFIILPVLFPAIRASQMLLLWFFAFACGISRIILVQHWPQDVLGGILLGCSASLWVHLLYERKLSKLGLPEKSPIALLGWTGNRKT